MAITERQRHQLFLRLEESLGTMVAFSSVLIAAVKL